MISLLQLATRAGIPRQSEIRSNCPVASSFLRLLLILATRILSTNGTSERAHLRSSFGVLATCSFGSDGITMIDLGLIDLDVKWIRNNVSFAASHSADASVEFS